MKTNQLLKLFLACFIGLMASSSLRAQNSLVYTDTFRSGVASTAAQKTTWDNYRATLTPHCWNLVNLKGTFNAVGVSTTDPTTITNLANALKNGTNGTFVFGANAWYVGTCGTGIELSMNNPTCFCYNPGNSIRPGGLSSIWGGVSTATCNGPTQRITVTFGFQNSQTTVTGPSPVCAFTTRNYTCAAVAGASNYYWTVPVGASVLSGQGTTAISVAFGNTTGNVNVETTTSCGISAPVGIPVTVNPLPVLTFPPLASICETASPFTLNTATPAGGTYSGNGVAGNVFDPAQATAGSHIITYTYTNVNTCVNRITQTINVNSAPNVLLANIPSVCINVAAYNISQGSPIGGTYSGIGVAGNLFYPNIAGIGTHNITYSFTNGNNCTDVATTTITVTSIPVAVISPFANVCLNDAPVMLSGGTPSGGYYSGPGVNVNYFYPTVAGVGTHTLSYVYNDGNGCSATSTQTITVNQLPTVTFTNPTSICSNASPVTLTTGLPAGGTYSGMGVNGGMFDPNIAGGGSHILTYTYFNGTCTEIDTATIVVLTLPNVSFLPFVNSVCSNGSPVALSGGMPSGGTYSGLGVNGGSFNPVTAGTGFHTITYTITGNNGCSNSTTQVMQVTAAPTVTIPATDIVCITQPAYTLAGGSPVNGSYSGAGVNAGMFDPTAAGVGIHPVVYSYTNALGCVGTATMQVTVNSCTGIQEAKFANLVNVYPNPNDGFFTIETVVAQNATLNIVLVNMLGEVVKTIENTEFQGEYKKQVEITDMPSGIYFVMVNTGSEKQVKRIIKN